MKVSVSFSPDVFGDLARLCEHVSLDESRVIRFIHLTDRYMEATSGFRLMRVPIETEGLPHTETQWYVDPRDLKHHGALLLRSQSSRYAYNTDPIAVMASDEEGHFPNTDSVRQVPKGARLGFIPLDSEFADVACRIAKKEKTVAALLIGGPGIAVQANRMVMTLEARTELTDDVIAIQPGFYRTVCEMFSNRSLPEHHVAFRYTDSESPIVLVQPDGSPPQDGEAYVIAPMRFDKPWPDSWMHPRQQIQLCPECLHADHLHILPDGHDGSCKLCGCKAAMDTYRMVCARCHHYDEYHAEDEDGKSGCEYASSDGKIHCECKGLTALKAVT